MITENEEYEEKKQMQWRKSVSNEIKNVKKNT